LLGGFGIANEEAPGSRSRDRRCSQVVVLLAIFGAEAFTSW
jgi:hypothetical protein